MDHLTVLVYIIIFLVVATTVAFVESWIDDGNYNNGYCQKCGGDYVFSGGTVTRNGYSVYYYTCENCGHTIETHTIQK